MLQTLIINAGGSSRRMGQPKALLPVPPLRSPSRPARPLLMHMVARLRPLAPAQTLVVASPAVAAGIAAWLRANDEDVPGKFHLLPDRDPPVGPLGGLATALARCDGWAALVACDMPLVNPDVFARLLREIDGSPTENPDVPRYDAVAPDRGAPDAVVPLVGERAQPLHALYHRRCLPAIEAQLAAGNRRMDSFFDDVHTRYVDEAALRQAEPTLHSFVNVNTPQEWQWVLTVLK